MSLHFPIFNIRMQITAIRIIEDKNFIHIRGVFNIMDQTRRRKQTNM